jgi:drug/metabolite transporter (DMT)-like permease
MARLWLIAAALLFSTGGVAIKGNTLTAWQVASYRSLVAAVVLAVAFPDARRNWTWRHMLVGSAYAATLIAFVAATKLTTAANAIFLQATAPAYVAVLGPFLLKERLKKPDLWLLAGVGAGMMMFFAASEPASASAPDPVTGNAFGFAAGIAAPALISASGCPFCALSGRVSDWARVCMCDQSAEACPGIRSRDTAND